MIDIPCVSSAYIHEVVIFRLSGKPLKYNGNKSGLRIDPWGPPQVIIFLDDSSVTVDNALLFPVR